MKLMLETNRCNTYCHAGTAWVSNGSQSWVLIKALLLQLEY